MNVGQIIIGRPWLYDNATIHDRSNMCRFEQEGKKIKLTLYRPITKKLKPNHRRSQKELI